MKEGKAFVTPQGILYMENYYSCGYALKNEWFLKAREKIGLITILYEPNNPSVILLVHENQIIPANLLLRSSELPKENHLYFRMINYYKKLLAEKKKRQSTKSDLRKGKKILILKQ
ncbi:hypothetical protein Elgi_60230 [Paenibacillus elgii]|nr:hypothetical protein Elgi_60230 [Paenibacillus elgii]